MRSARWLHVLRMLRMLMHVRMWHVAVPLGVHVRILRILRLPTAIRRLLPPHLHLLRRIRRLTRHLSRRRDGSTGRLLLLMLHDRRLVSQPRTANLGHRARRRARRLTRSRLRTSSLARSIHVHVRRRTPNSRSVDRGSRAEARTSWTTRRRLARSQVGLRGHPAHGLLVGHLRRVVVVVRCAVVGWGREAREALIGAINGHIGGGHDTTIRCIRME